MRSAPLLSIVEQTTQGDLLSMSLLIFVLTVAYLQGDILEDLICGGTNRFGGVWHNWDFFMPPYAIFYLGYLIHHLHHGHEVHGAWRHPEGSISDTVWQKRQSPLSWPQVHYESQEDDFWLVVLMAHLVYGLATLYYQLSWKAFLQPKSK